MLIAQLSDPHLRLAVPPHGLVDTAALLRQCLAHVLAQETAPDLLLITGDLVDSGQETEYALLQAMLAPLPMPALLLPGNHDERHAMRRVFTGPAYAYLHQHPDFLQYVYPWQDLRLVVLDTVVPGHPHGELCTQRLDWLAARLDEDATPTVVVMHHPPFLTGLAEMDHDMGLQHGAAELEALIGRHPQVQAVWCGHLHRPIQTRFGGTVASTCPSTAHQIALDLRAGEPARFTLAPPGYQLHLWQSGRLVTHTVTVGAYPGPYDFDLC